MFKIIFFPIKEQNDKAMEDELIISRYKFYNEGKIEIIAPKPKTPIKKKSIIKYFKLLVNRGFDIEKPFGNFEDNKVIHFCSQMEDTETVKYLIEIGADVNSETKFGETPLHFACYQGCLELVKILVDNGANLESENNYKERPIHKACSSYSDTAIDVVKYLIEKNVNLKCETTYGETPLSLSAKNKNKDMFLLMIEQDVEVNLEIKDKGGYVGCTYNIVQYLYRQMN